MATPMATQMARFEDLPVEVIHHIASCLDCDDSEAILAAVKGEGDNTPLYDKLNAYISTRLIAFRLDIGSEIIDRQYLFGGIVRDLEQHQLHLATLYATPIPSITPDQFSAYSDSLGRRISQLGLSFPALRCVTLDVVTTMGLDLIPYLAKIAPDLETLVADVRRYDFGGESYNSAEFKDPESHPTLRNLRIMHSFGAKSLHLTQQLVDMCPNAEDLRLTLSPWQETLEERTVLDRLLTTVCRLPVAKLEWSLELSTFVECLLEHTVGLPSLREMSLRTFSWDTTTYRIPSSDSSTWPSLGMTPRLADCLRQCPLLNILLRRKASGMLSGPEYVEQAYISSYIHPPDEGELLHCRLLMNGEWEEVTEYMGEVVPFEVINTMRALEGLTNEEWPGSERGRGRVVGINAWEHLMEWYETGPRAPTEPIIDQIRAFPAKAVVGIKRAMKSELLVFFVVPILISIIYSVLPIGR